jgi:hypothetical protein
VLALAVAGTAVDHRQRHGSAKAHAPARIQPVPERSRSPKRITKTIAMVRIRANRRDFLRPRIARHSRGLRRHQSVLWPSFALTDVAFVFGRKATVGRMAGTDETTRPRGASRTGGKRTLGRATTLASAPVTPPQPGLSNALEYGWPIRHMLDHRLDREPRIQAASFGQGRLGLIDSAGIGLGRRQSRVNENSRKPESSAFRSHRPRTASP